MTERDEGLLLTWEGIQHEIYGKRNKEKRIIAEAKLLFCVNKIGLEERRRRPLGGIGLQGPWVEY